MRCVASNVKMSRGKNVLSCFKLPHLNVNTFQTVSPQRRNLLECRFEKFTKTFTGTQREMYNYNIIAQTQHIE